MAIATSRPRIRSAFVHGLSDAVLTTARTPRAASASVITR
jgi:hypothetical protein